MFGKMREVLVLKNIWGDVIVNEFRSKIENIVPVRELFFPSTPAFGKYNFIMPEDSVAHPAKFNTNLVEFLIETYTKEGDVILDPMAGTGIMGVIASLKGRNAVQVELESRFFEWMEKARENVEKTQTITPKGWIKNIHGDARRLSELITTIDICITSPPYESSFEGGSRHSGGILEREKKHGVDTVLLIGEGVKYSDDKNNIGNLKSSKEEYESLEHATLYKSYRETYLSAMLIVYKEIWKVLKEGGLAIVVVKPLIRSKKVIDLPYYTWKLLENVGFKLEKVYKLRLDRLSFWRILYYKKHQNVPVIHHEYVLVVKKGDVVG